MRNHLSMFSNCSFPWRSKFKILLSESKKQVSSAYRVVSNCVASGRSFTEVGSTELLLYLYTVPNYFFSTGTGATFGFQ